MKLKVNHLNVTVSPMTPIEASDNGSLGLYRPHAQAIALRADMSPEEQARVLLHEVLHACFDGFDLGDISRDEEATCEALDGPLACVFRDNPELLGVLHQALSKGKRIV